MNKEYVSIFRRWSVSAILGFILSLFSYACCTGMISVILCTISLHDCKKNAKRGFRLALTGLIIALILTASVLSIMAENKIGPDIYVETAVFAMSMIGFGVAITFMALVERTEKRKYEQKQTRICAEQHRSKQISRSFDRAEIKSQIQNTEKNTERKQSREEKENCIVVSTVDLKPLGLLLEEIPPKDIPWDLCIARWMVQKMDDMGFAMLHVSIGGGSDEVSHTGAVAYGGGYVSSKAFITDCYDDYRKADAAAAEEYGSWFSSLNYHYVRIQWERENIRIYADITYGIRIRWEGGEKGEIIARTLEEKLKIE